MKQIYRKNQCQSVISIKLLCNFIEIALQDGCFPVNSVHIFRTPFLKRTPLDGCFWDWYLCDKNIHHERVKRRRTLFRFYCETSFFRFFAIIYWENSTIIFWKVTLKISLLNHLNLWCLGVMQAVMQCEVVEH